MTGWSGPKDQQNKTDNFLPVTGTLYIIVNSPKNKGKTLTEYILKDLVQRGFNVEIAEIQHALLIQGILDCENQIQAIQYENVALEVQKKFLPGSITKMSKSDI